MAQLQTPPLDLNETSSSSGKTPSTPEGMMIAYGSLLLMAVLPIILGSFRSVDYHLKQKKEQQDSGTAPETMTCKDAALFPIIASCALFGLYIFFQIFSKEHVNLLLSGYFFILGIFGLTHTLGPQFSKVFTTLGWSPLSFSFLFKKEEQTLLDFSFKNHDIVTSVFASLFGIWYLWKKHWIANNVIGIAFSINGVEMLHLNSVLTGCILLGGLFFYDIFWVFGTDVMVTVAKSFDAPIKLVFPQDILEHGILESKNMAMLGLGDIVIPGIFAALLLRYDVSLKRQGSLVYFKTTMIAYISGLLMTIGIMHFFKHAQPALLYLVPTCVSFPCIVALIKGDLGSLFSYEDHPKVEESTEKKEK